MRTRHVIKAAAGAGVALASLIGACSLGLDASKLNANLEEAGTDVTVDVGGEVNVPPGTTRCTQNSDCGDKACYSGKCVDGVCKVDLCPTQEYPCQYSTCTGTSCSPPAPNKFRATTMSLGQAGLGCGRALGACVAVVYPFAFVGPNTGDVAAYPIVDFSPSTPDAGLFSPPAVKVLNVGQFAVTRMVASGRRVWFIGTLQGIGSVSQVPVAWVDVPADASLKTLTATKGVITLPARTSIISAAFPGADGGLLVLLSESVGAPASQVTQLKVGVDGGLDPATEFNSLPGFDGGPSIVASSGDRLVTAHPTAGPPAAFYGIAIIANAGAGNAYPIATNDLTLAIAPQALYAPASFASTPRGGVLAQAAVAQLEVDGGVASVVGVEGVRLGWFLQQADDPTVQSKGIAKVLTYPEAGVLSPDPGLVGPIAAIGEDKVIALHREADASAVRVVVREPGTTNTSVPTTSHGTLERMPGDYVMSGARSEVTGKEYGYAFSRPPTDADGVRLTIFEVGCGN